MILRVTLCCHQIFIFRKTVYGVILRRNNDFTGFQISNTMVFSGIIYGKIEIINIFRSNQKTRHYMIVIPIERNISLVGIGLPLLL